MKLLVGLGNPGKQYSRNRHNVGFMAVDKIAETHKFKNWRGRFQGLVADGQIDSIKCLLLKPETFMNDSGFAVGEAVRFYKIPMEGIFVFHDEIDLSSGKIKVKAGGGSAGHNGLKSVTSQIGNDYTRIRIGVDHPGRKEQVHKYVLQNFSTDDQTWLPQTLDAIAEACGSLVAGRADKFMNELAILQRPQTVSAETKTSRSEKTDNNRNKLDQDKSTEKSDAETGVFTEKLKSWFSKKDS